MPRRRLLPPPRLWPRRTKRFLTAAPVGAAVLLGAVLVGAPAPRRFCAVRAFCRRQNLAGGRIHSARGFQKIGAPAGGTPVGRDCPPTPKRRPSPPLRPWPRKADSKPKTVAPTGAAVFWRGSPRGRASAPALLRRPSILPQAKSRRRADSFRPRISKNRGPRRRNAGGEGLPPNAQEKAIAAAKALAEEG